MTLDEAIANALEVAKQNERKAEYRPRMDSYDEIESRAECLQCAADHRQLAEWLQDYKMLRGEYDNCQLNSIEDYRREAARCRSAYFKVNSELCHMKISLSEYHKEFAEFKRLLKAAVEDIVWLNEHTVDGEGGCLIETATDMETCLACPLNVNNSHICGWKHQAEALALIGEDGDTE